MNGDLSTAVDKLSTGWFTDHLTSHFAHDTEALEKVCFKNALQLFPQMAALLDVAHTGESSNLKPLASGSWDPVFKPTESPGGVKA